ncbi:MAG: 3-keto-5-aminohexanoate cleavage protein [Stappiaceae bacterium]
MTLQVSTTLPQLMVAPTGARRGKNDHPKLPITLQEILKEAKDCQREGADGVHLHIRNENGDHSLDVGLYREAIAEFSIQLPGLFLQVTTEAAGIYGPTAQCELVRNLRPAAVSIAFREIMADPGSRSANLAIYQEALETGIAVQHIIYTPQELSWFLSVLDEGSIPGTSHALQFVLGSYDGRDTSRPEDLKLFLDYLEPRRKDMRFDWMLCAFGPEETACLVEAHRQEGKIRVGFENSLWHPDGTVAQSNADRVRQVREALETG